MRSFTLSVGAGVAVALACLLALAAFGGVGAAAAQEGEVGPDDVPQDRTGNDSENYLIAIDSETRVVSADWSGDQVTLVIESDVTRQVTIVDASQRLQGAVDIRRQRVTVPGGERAEVTFTVRNGDRPAVTASTRWGMVGIGDQPDGQEWFDGPASWTLIFLTVPVVGYGTFWGTKRYLEKQEREQEERQIEVIR